MADPKDERKMSCFDLFIVQKNLLKYVDTLEVDRSLNFTPFYVDNTGASHYPDHYACVITFKGIPIKTQDTKRLKLKEIKWNTNKKEGWTKYRQLTDENSILDDIGKSNEMDNVEVIDKMIEREINKIKHKAFGKISYEKKYKSSDELKRLQDEKARIIFNSKNENEVTSLVDINERIKESLLDNQRKTLCK